jgi:hypothetical protein
MSIFSATDEATLTRCDFAVLTAILFTMTSPQYDVFKKAEAGLTWVETARDFESATRRMEELAQQNQCQYLVYDQRSKRIVASFG